MRLGDLDDLKFHISELMLVYSGTELDNAILNAIDNAPTVEINTDDIEYKAYCRGLEDGKMIARPQGEWKHIIDEYNDVECPFCGFQEDGIYYNYCPKCGAKMGNGE